MDLFDVKLVFYPEFTRKLTLVVKTDAEWIGIRFLYPDKLINFVE